MDLTSPSIDAESDPSFVMLDESDDEETIAQEESLEPEIDREEELRILANDLNVGLEELVAQSGTHRSRRKQKKVDYQAMLLEEQMKRVPKSLAKMCYDVLLQHMDVAEAGPSSSSDLVLTEFYCLNSLSLFSDRDEDDTEYKPRLKPTFSQEIRTGPSYQAEVPEEPAGSSSGDADAQCDDKLMWKPTPVLNDEELEHYLCRFNSIVKYDPIKHKQDPVSNKLMHSDSEKALELLLQCNFNADLAIDKTIKGLHQRIAQFKAISAFFNNESNSRRENVENEASNEFPSPPKMPKK